MRSRQTQGKHKTFRAKHVKLCEELLSLSQKLPCFRRELPSLLKNSLHRVAYEYSQALHSLDWRNSFEITQVIKACESRSISTGTGSDLVKLSNQESLGYRMLSTDQVATAPCTDLIQVRLWEARVNEDRLRPGGFRL